MGDLPEASGEQLEIVFLYEFPKAAKFCSAYMMEHWNWSLEKAVKTVEPCLSKQNLPYILVAKEKDLPVGCIMAQEEDGLPWITLLYVDKKYRNRGIGKSLGERAFKEMKKLGYKTVYTDTVEHAEAYKRMGWKFIKTRPWRDTVTHILSKEL